MAKHLDKQHISVIGLRGYPAEFEGTSGVEFYVQRIIEEIIHTDKNFTFVVYTKSNYQSRENAPKEIVVKKTQTLQLKVFESVIYSFLASLKSLSDESNSVWYNGIGQAIFSWIPMMVGKKIVVTIHSEDWKRDKWTKLEKLLFKFIVILTFKLPIEFVAVSDELQIKIRQDFRVNSLVAPPGVSEYDKLTIEPRKILKEFNLKKNSFILYLGRIVPEKRIEWIIKAFTKVKQKYPTLKLVIAGGGGNSPRYEKEVRLLAPDDNIVWTGYVFGETKTAFLRNCLLFASASRLEGASLSLLEGLVQSRNCLVANDAILNDWTKLDCVTTFDVNSYTNFEKKMIDVIDKQLIIPRIRYPNRVFRRLSKKYNWKFSALVYKEVFIQTLI